MIIWDMLKGKGDVAFAKTTNQTQVKVAMASKTINSVLQEGDVVYATKMNT